MHLFVACAFEGLRSLDARDRIVVQLETSSACTTSDRRTPACLSAVDPYRWGAGVCVRQSAFSEQVSSQYGRKSGWLRHQYARVLDKAGAHAAMRRIDWDAVSRLVFVCQGNICRSAYAEARARKSGLSAASFGLGARDGDAADPKALEAASKRGVDLGGHRATSRDRFAPRQGDLLLAMERSHLAGLSAPEGRVTLLGLWASPPRPHLEDPYGLSRGYFGTCFSVIDDAVGRIAGLAGSARAG
jgi:protein-tyrosine-phosphatase